MDSIGRKLDSLGLSFNGSTRSGRNRTSPLRQTVLTILAILAFVALIASWSMGRTVRRSTQQIVSESLRSILAANVAMLQDWFATQKADVVNLASVDAVHESAVKILAESKVNFQWDEKDLDRLEEFSTLQDQLGSDQRLGWCVIDPGNVVVASEFGDLIGQTIPVSDHVRLRVMARKPAIVLPFKSPVAIQSAGPLSIAGGPVMGAMMPLLDDNRLVGSLVVLIDPLERFSELLTIARTGATGKTYAFDREGVLLTQSRFEDQLRRAKMLPSDPNVVSALNVTVRDPGVNVVEGLVPALSADEQSLTIMADHAIRGGSGENLTGYNDYRGVKVVGVWTWLPEYSMGIATEADLHEAFAPARLLNRSFRTLLSILATALFGVLFLAWRENAAGRRSAKETRSEGDVGDQRFGRYQLGELLGRGGMGSVYRGKHELLQRPVAIKVLAGCETDRKTAAVSSSSRKPVNQDAITRFEREVQLTASLRHPNTIHIYDYGRADDGTFFYVMEYIDGITLQQLIDDFGAQPPSRVIHLLLQVCGSLREAHSSGLIHRDVKPANVLLTAEAGATDWIKVLDFGLIKSMTTGVEDQSLTQSDTVTGTPMYMSPECVRDATESNALSDLYSLGAVGYALLTGKPIFEGTGSVDICMKQLNEMPPRPESRLNCDLPDDLQNVLMSCLQKDPKDRPQSIDELASALRSCDDAMSWTESDSIHWWEVVYRNALIDNEENAADANKEHDTLKNKSLENEV